MIRSTAIFALIVLLTFAIVSCGKETYEAEDTEPPTVSIDSPPDNAVRNGEVTVIVSADDDDDVERVELYVAGELVGTSVEEPYEFVINMDDVAPDASVSVHAVAVDLSENETVSTVVTYTQGANVPPVATLSSATLNLDGTTILQDDTIILSGSGDDPDSDQAVKLTWSSNLQGQIYPDSDNEFTGLTIGEHTISLIATDKDDVTGIAEFTITVEDNPNNDYAYIPSGEYYIGQPIFDRSKVKITRSFWMAKTEMTVKEVAQGMALVYGDDSVVKSFLFDRTDDLWDGGEGLYPAVYDTDPPLGKTDKTVDYEKLIYKDYPAVFLMYTEIIDMCNALSDRDGLTPAYDVQKKAITFIKGANGWRLPTEAEWEIAARGGLDGKKYPWGDTSPVGMCNSMSEQSLSSPMPLVNGRGPVPVRSYEPNGFGLYDMAGNAAEMCSDMFPEIGGGVPSGTDPVTVSEESLPRYVVKGGCWYGYGEAQQISVRSLTIPYNTKNKDAYNSGIGLRLVRNVE